MQLSQKRKLVEVDRGLFLIRYATAEDAAAPPSVRFSTDPSSREDIRFIVHPDDREPLLRYPGHCLVMRADARGRVAIDITPGRRNGSIAAKVLIEPLAQDESQQAPQTGDIQPLSHRIETLRIVGHVASRGDVAVRADDWLAGPAAPARIEGFQIDWPGKPKDLDLRYAAKTTRAAVASGQMVGLGIFVGSRGKSLPISGIALELAGPSAERYRLAAEMIFLGSPIQRTAGLRIVGSGTTGGEPLVGLRLTVEESEQPDEMLSVAHLVRPPRPVERVRVFRSEHADRGPTA